MAGEDLVLKISADTKAVASGLAPMTDALDHLSKEASEADKELADLSGTRLRLDTSGIEQMERALAELEEEVHETEDALEDISRTRVTLNIKEEAIARARKEIDRLRDDIAQNIIMGVDTTKAQRELASLQSSVKKLTDTPAVVDVEVKGLTEDLAGLESGRENALGLSEAIGQVDGSLSSLVNVAREMVPTFADMNDSLVDFRTRSEAAGKSSGRFMTGLSAVSGFMSGPWGLAVAAGVGLLVGFVSKMGDADEATKQWAESLDEQAGAMDRANRTATAKLLSDEGLLTKAKAFGISTMDLTSALLGNEEAVARVDRKLRELNEQRGAGQQFVHDFREMQSTMGEVAATSALMNEAIGITGTVVDDLALRTFDAEDAWAGYDDALQKTRKSIDDMIDSLNVLNGEFASTQQATSDYEQGLDDLSEAMKNSKRNLSLTNEVGRQNSALVREQAANIADLAKARLREADVSGESTSKIVADYGKQREGLIKTIDGLGLSRAAAEKYVDSLLETPDELTTDVKVTGIAKAEDQVDDLTRARTISVNVKLNIDKFAENEARRRIREIEAGNLSATSSSAPSGGTGPAPAPTVFMQPRVFLDSRPIRAAMRADVTATVASTFASTRQRGRL